MLFRTNDEQKAVRMTADLEPVLQAGTETKRLEEDSDGSRVLTLGIPDLDARLGGLVRRGLHETVPAGASQLAAAIGFGLGLAIRAAGPRPIVWASHDILASESGRLDGSGLAAFGAKPEKVLVISLRRAEDVLRASLEAARSPGLGAALVEIRGDARAVDFVATRRLALATKTSGVTMILVRSATRLDSTAAATRWRVGFSPSIPLEGYAPGHPAFQVTLLRNRGGTSEHVWRMEWSRDRRSFAEAPPLLGGVVPAPADRPPQAVPWRGSMPEARRVG